MIGRTPHHMTTLKKAALWVAFFFLFAVPSPAPF